MQCLILPVHEEHTLTNCALYITKIHKNTDNESYRKTDELEKQVTQSVDDLCNALIKKRLGLLSEEKMKRGKGCWREK